MKKTASFTLPVLLIVAVLTGLAVFTLLFSAPASAAPAGPSGAYPGPNHPGGYPAVYLPAIFHQPLLPAVTPTPTPSPTPTPTPTPKPTKRAYPAPGQ